MQEAGAVPGRRNPVRASLRRLAGRAREHLDRYHRTVPSYLLDRQDKLLAGGLTLFFFLLYLYTCSHKVNLAGDSPELIGASYSLGIVHPPGYPLYTLLGYLFTHIPVGSVAFRLNFASTLYHSLAILFLFLSLLKVTRSKAAAAIATAALGLSSLFWFYSLLAEVFPLNDLFCVLLIYVAIRVRERWVDGDREGSERLFLLLAFLAGLSLTHHHTILLVFPTLLLFDLYPFLSAARKPKRLALVALLFLAGLLPYLYLPIRAAQGPYLNFADPSSLRSFFEVVTRRYYGTSRLWAGPAAVHRLDLVFDFLKTLGREVHLYGLVLGAIGMFAMARKRFGDFLPLFAGLLLTGALFPFMANVELESAFHIATIERFYLIPIIFFTFFIAMGTGAVIVRLKSLLARLKAREDLKRGLSWVAVLLLALPFLLPAAATSADVNLKYDELGEAYLANLLASVEEGALVFVQGDAAIQLMGYYETVEKARKDLVSLSYSFLLNPWYIETVHKYHPDLVLPDVSEVPAELSEDTAAFRGWLIAYLVRNNPQIPAFYILTPESALSDSFRFIPWGLAYKFLPLDEEVDMSGYRRFQEKYWKEFDYAGMNPSFYSYNRRESYLVPFIANYPKMAGDFSVQEGRLETASFLYLQGYLMAQDPDFLRKLADVSLREGEPLRALDYLVTLFNQGSIYDPGTWAAMMEIEDILAEGGSEDGR